MCNPFLENMYRSLVLVRSDVQNSKNIEIMKMLISSLEKEMSACEVKKQSMDFAKTALYMVQTKLEEGEYELAYDLVDMLHAFPQVLMAKDEKQEAEYWEIYVRPVMEKWEISW